MPQRKVTRKVETPDIQGDDSYVIIRPMTIGEVLSIQQETIITPNLRVRLVAYLRRLFRIKDKPPNRVEVYQTFANRVLDFVADWNWVDDDGEPLPSPRKDPDVVKLLTDAELLALTRIIYGSKDDTKN